MAYIEFDLSLKLLTFLFYGIFYFISYWLIIYNIGSKEKNGGELFINPYLFHSHILQLFFFFAYFIEKHNSKAILENSLQIVVEHKRLDNGGLMIEKSLVKYDKDKVLKEVIGLKKIDFWIMSLILIFCGLVNIIQEKIRFLLYTNSDYYVWDFYDSFHNGIKGGFVLLVILIVYKLNGVHKDMGRHHIISLTILIIINLGITFLLFISSDITFIKSLSISPFIFIIFEVILTGIEFILQRYILITYFLSTYLILGIKGFIKIFIDLALFLGIGLYNNDFVNVHHMFKISFMKNIIFGIVAVVSYNFSEFFMIRSIDLFSAYHGFISYLMSQVMMILFSLFYYSFIDKEAQVDTFFYLFAFFVIMFVFFCSLIFTEIIILNCFNLNKGTLRYLKKMEEKLDSKSITRDYEMENNHKDKETKEENNHLRMNSISSSSDISFIDL